MKIVLSILISLFVLSSYGQTPQSRATEGNTVVDERLHAKRNFSIPRYEDTTSANLDLVL